MNPFRMMCGIVALVMIGAACGGAESANDPNGTDTDRERQTAQPDEAGQAAADGTVDGDLTFMLASGYSALAIAEGVKPDLALAPGGAPGIAYLLEDLSGFIGYASADDGWDPNTVAEGYFYGPIGLAYTSDGTPHIAYHDHQANQFDQALGDLTVATETPAGWDIVAIPDDGHDGWDTTIVVGPDDVVRAAGIDPEQFGRTQGVEYFELGEAGWEVTEIGSGPVQYEFNVSLAVTPDGDPALTYFDTTDQELRYAVRTDAIWSIETVDADGDAGRYSSLAFDDSGTPHISYLRLDGSTTGKVRYATNDGSGWVTEDVGDLDAILTGFTGARRVTDIAIDSSGSAQIVYSDEQVIRRAIRESGAWSVSTVVEAGDRLLGQLVSFALDEDDSLHLAMFEVTRSNPLNGMIAYITG